jgi:hypothetical protein
MSSRTGSRSCAATQAATDRSAIHRAPARSGILTRDGSGRDRPHLGSGSCAGIGGGGWSRRFVSRQPAPTAKISMTLLKPGLPSRDFVRDLQVQQTGSS